MAEEKGLPPAERKEQTTNRINKKITALSQALTNRRKDRFHGLPKTFAAFHVWRGEGNEESLSEIHRQTLNSREDLKDEVRTLIAERKNVPEEESSAKDQHIKELEKCIEGLAGENHEMKLEIDRLRDDLSLRESRINKLESNMTKTKSTVSKIRD